MKNLGQKMNRLGTSRRTKIEARADVLIGKEMTLQQLRRARKAKVKPSPWREVKVVESATKGHFHLLGHVDKKSLR